MNITRQHFIDKLNVKNPKKNNGNDSNDCSYCKRTHRNIDFMKAHTHIRAKCRRSCVDKCSTWDISATKSAWSMILVLLFTGFRNKLRMIFMRLQPLQFNLCIRSLLLSFSPKSLACLLSCQREIHWLSHSGCVCKEKWKRRTNENFSQTIFVKGGD